MNGFVLRLLFAAILVFVTWNPSGYSFTHWLQNGEWFTPEKALAAVALIIGWTIYLRATMRSLGPIGVIMVAAICACIVWLLFDKGWITQDATALMAWIVLVCTTLILALGMSWSIVRRRISGQVDMDDVDQ